MCAEVLTAPAHVDAIRTKLRGYAERGVFRGFREETTRNGKTVFQFSWLMDRPFTLIVDERKGALQFKDLLPNLPAQTPLYAGIRAFLKSRQAEDMLPNKRVDPERATLRCFNRKGSVSIELNVINDDYAYGINKILPLVNELFGYLHLYHPQYLWENFDVPAE